MNTNLKPKSFPLESSTKYSDLLQDDREQPAVLPSADLVAVPHRVDYEQLVSKALSLLWGRKFLVAAICIAAIILAGAAHLLIEPRYEATAVIQFDLGNQDTPSGTAGIATIDGGKIVESDARLIQTRTIARRVVLRLGLDKSRAESKLRSFIAKTIRKWRLNDTVSPSRVDRAVERLSGNLIVENDNKSYLINVTYSAPSPSEAARIANAIVGEYMHIRRKQKLANRRAFASRELRKLKNIYGGKHPLIARAEANFAQAHAQWEAAGQEAPLKNEREIAESGYIVPAHEVTIPSGPKLSTILVLALFAGLIGGIGLALVLERHAMRELLTGSLIRHRRA